MIVNVKTRSGATFQFASRKDLRKAMDKPGAEPLSDDKYTKGWVKDAPEWQWRPVRVLHLRRISIDHVVAAEDVALSPEDLPAQAVAEERKASYEKREAERADAEQEGTTSE